MKIENVQAVRHLVMNRPERRNALGTESMEELAAALDAADRDDSVHAVVLSGAPPAFCAGSDLKELATLTIDGMRLHELATARTARMIAGLSKPVIAAVEGYALGGGFILAASCDIVVTAADARWHLPEVANGWLPPWGLQALLVRVGPVRARLLTWGAQPVDGGEALRLGVADYLSPAGQAANDALAIGASLAALPATAVASCKRYYEPFATQDGERLDQLSARQFAADCDGATAQATLKKFKRAQ